MIQRIHQAIILLKQQGQQLTKTAICHSIGQDLNNLRTRYPTVWAVVSSYSESETQPQTDTKKNADERQQTYRRQTELIHKVERAIEQLQRQGKSVSQYAIADLVGMSKGALYYYPQVRAILCANKAKPQSRDEDALLARVRTAIADLEIADARVSQAAVARLVGLSPCAFNSYPRVKVFLREQVIKYQQRRAERHRQREAALVVHVQQAIVLLAITENRITQKAIGESVGIPLTHLYRYPRVKLLLQQVSSRPGPTHPLSSGTT